MAYAFTHMGNFLLLLLLLLLPTSWYMLDVEVKGAAAPKELMTYAGLSFEH